MYAAEFGVGQVVWSMFWFFLFVIWILLVIRVFADIFRSRDLGGVAKVLWTLLVILTPYLGVFLYLIVRGRKLAENEQRAAVEQQEAVRAYIRDAAGSGSVADELERLAGLRDRGIIDEAEFGRLKAKVVG